MLSISCYISNISLCQYEFLSFAHCYLNQCLENKQPSSYKLHEAFHCNIWEESSHGPTYTKAYSHYSRRTEVFHMCWHRILHYSQLLVVLCLNYNVVFFYYFQIQSFCNTYGSYICMLISCQENIFLVWSQYEATYYSYCRVQKTQQHK